VNILIVTYFLNGFLMIAMPVGLAIFLIRRWKLSGDIWWIGFVTFVISQVGHIPFNAGAGLVLNRTGLVYWSPVAQLLFNAVFLGLSAGLFEEGARYFVLRFWAKEARSWRTGTLFGAGHGGSEAIILGLLALVNYGAWMVMRSPQGFDWFLSSGLIPGTQAQDVQQQLAAVWSLPWVYSLLPALERLLAIPIQICLALLVLQGFIRKQWFWFWVSVLFHAIVDGTAVLLSRYLGVYWTEAVVAGFSIFSLVVIFLLRQPEPEMVLEPAAIPIKDFKPTPVDETDENLDKTRYQ